MPSIYGGRFLGAAISNPSITPAEQTRPQAIAPAWHTVATLVMFLAMSALGASGHRFSFFAVLRGRSRAYLFSIGLEWGTLAFVAFGLRTRGFRLRDLLGRNAPGIGAGLVDLGIAFGFMVVSNIVLGLLSYLLMRTPDNQVIRNLMPHGLKETVLYLLLCFSAGICEEIVFRGYFQRQFAALTGSVALGLVLQGAAFGASHGYQGIQRMLIIAVYGCLFGWLARWRGGLRPGMVAHFLQDSLAGLLAARLLK